ncbi:hypothetical protein WA538_005984 [Blastocystis sp. DL]
MMTIVKEGWLDSKHFILAIPDRYGDEHVHILQAILASCLYPSVSFVHSSIAASYGCFSLCNPKNATTFLVVDIGSHSCKCILFFADANHIKILKFKESFEVNGDLADRVLFDTVRDSMDHIGSFSDAENASIYRSLNKDKNLFSETQCKEVPIKLEINEDEVIVEVTNEKYTRALKRRFEEPLRNLLTDLLADMPQVDLVLPVGGQSFNSRIISWVVDIIGSRQKKPVVSNAANKYDFLAESSWQFLCDFMNGQLEVTGTGASSGFWPSVSPLVSGDAAVTVEVCEVSESKQPKVLKEMVSLNAMMMVKRMRKEEDDHKSIIQRRAVLTKKLAELQDRENSEEVKEKLNQIRSLLGKNKLDEADALMGTLKEKEEKTSSNCFIPSTYRSSGTNLEVTVVNRASDSVRQASSLPVQLDKSITSRGIEERRDAVGNEVAVETDKVVVVQPRKRNTLQSSEKDATLDHAQTLSVERRSYIMVASDGIITAEPTLQQMVESSSLYNSSTASISSPEVSQTPTKKEKKCQIQ